MYASNQKDEHQRYKSIYDANAEEFAMVEQMQRYAPYPLPHTARTDFPTVGRYGVPGDAWDHRMSVDSLAEREYPQQGYTSSAVIDAGGSYEPHPDAYAEGQGHPTQQGYAAPHPDEFASEAEYREYMQHMEDQQRERYPGQQGYAQGYDDAAPGGYPQQGYHTPPPGYAGDGQTRGDGKYGYVPR